MRNDVDRLRELLEAAAAELATRREDVLSSTLIWPERGLDADDCAAFLLAIDEQLAVLDAAGYVTVARATHRAALQVGHRGRRPRGAHRPGRLARRPGARQGRSSGARRPGAPWGHEPSLRRTADRRRAREPASYPSRPAAASPAASRAALQRQHDVPAVGRRALHRPCTGRVQPARAACGWPAGCTSTRSPTCRRPRRGVRAPRGPGRAGDAGGPRRRAGAPLPLGRRRRPLPRLAAAAPARACWRPSGICCRCGRTCSPTSPTTRPAPPSRRSSQGGGRARRPSPAGPRPAARHPDAVVIGLGSMIGAGVFVALRARGRGGRARAAGRAGAGAAVVAWCNATSSAQLAAEYPSSGGTYVYGRERLGEWLGLPGRLGLRRRQDRLVRGDGRHLRDLRRARRPLGPAAGRGGGGASR